MADFSLTTLFVVPSTQTALPSTGSTQNLAPGIVGLFDNNYAPLLSGTTPPYFYLAQGRTNNYLQGSKRSDKLAKGSVKEWYKVTGNSTVLNQVTEISNFTAKCGDDVTLTIRGFSTYLDTVFFSGYTKSITVKTPCCDCGTVTDPCATVDASLLVDILLAKLNEVTYANGTFTIGLNKFYTFAKSGTGINSKLVITGKPLTKYGNECDVAAFPFEYDRLRFDVFIHGAPDSSADFIVSDACKKLATVTKIQEATFPKGTGTEIVQMEKNYYSYQTGLMKHLFRMNGFNQAFEPIADSNLVYNTYYIKVNEAGGTDTAWGDYVPMDSTVVIAVPSTSAFNTDLTTLLTQQLGVL